MADTPFPISSRDPAEAIKQMRQLIDELYQERIAGANVGDVFQISEDDVLTLKLKDNSGLAKTGSALSLNTGFGLEINANVLRVIAATFLQATNNLSDLENKLTARTNLEADGIVDRGDPADWDFILADLTVDAAWHDLDLSSLVPAGAKQVRLRASFQNNTLTEYVSFRKNGNVNVHGAVKKRVRVINSMYDEYFDVPCDANRVIEYLASNSGTWAGIYICVIGWTI